MSRFWFANEPQQQVTTKLQKSICKTCCSFLVLSKSMSVKFRAIPIHAGCKMLIAFGYNWGDSKVPFWWLYASKYSHTRVNHKVFRALHISRLSENRSKTTLTNETIFFVDIRMNAAKVIIAINKEETTKTPTCRLLGNSFKHGLKVSFCWQRKT